MINSKTHNTQKEKRLCTSISFNMVIAVIALLFISLLPPPKALAQDGMHHGRGHGHGHGHSHDEVNMPGLQGKDTTTEEVAEMQAMFNNFEKINRSVVNLPNGIKTTTSSHDETLYDAIVAHVTGMTGRVEEGRDPKVLIQSPTLDILFEHRNDIITDIETTQNGIIVTQTSDNPIVVAALQKHAQEVSAMADRGMDAVHEMMMKRHKQ